MSLPNDLIDLQSDKDCANCRNDIRNQPKAHSIHPITSLVVETDVALPHIHALEPNRTGTDGATGESVLAGAQQLRDWLTGCKSDPEIHSDVRSRLTRRVVERRLARVHPSELEDSRRVVTSLLNASLPCHRRWDQLRRRGVRLARQIEHSEGSDGNDRHCQLQDWIHLFLSS